MRLLLGMITYGSYGHFSGFTSFYCCALLQLRGKAPPPSPVPTSMYRVSWHCLHSMAMSFDFTYALLAEIIMPWIVIIWPRSCDFSSRRGRGFYLLKTCTWKSGQRSTVLVPVSRQNDSFTAFSKIGRISFGLLRSSSPRTLSKLFTSSRSTVM